MTTIAEPRPAAQLAEGEDQLRGEVVVVGGVDTHADTHTAAVIDATGHLLGYRQFPTTAAGYAALTEWMAHHGRLQVVGVEGTGSYGAGLARYLASAGVHVVEVNRPDRSTRHRVGKSDPADAEAAARAVLAGRAVGTPKRGTGPVEAIRTLRVARRGAVAARAKTVVRLKALVTTAPETLRALLRDLPAGALVTTCAGMRPDPAATAAGEVTAATKTALRSLARRHVHLSAEIADLDAALAPLVAATSPALVAAYGVGTDVAGQLLITAGDNPERLTSEAAFAALCGVSPIPASSGRTTRHRLNRGGDRAANAALYRVVLCRMRWHAPTREYVARRTAQGLSKKEIIRCLKRYIAREIYHLITTPAASPATA